MNKTRIVPVLLATLVGSASVAVLVGFASGRAAAPARSSQAAVSVGKQLQNDFVRVYRQVAPSVVQIQTAGGLGSGIVFDSKGNIVTNAHVVGEAKTFTVTTSTGKQLKGSLVGTFVADDLAVIRVRASGLSPAAFADSSRLEVGDIAIAIGNPLGLDFTVTAGIISAKGRSNELRGLNQNQYAIQDFIQTDAAISFGNSGGPLILRPFILDFQEELGAAFTAHFCGELVDRGADHLRLLEGIGIALAASGQPSDEFAHRTHFGWRIERFFGLTDTFADPGEIFHLHSASSSIR